MSKAKRKVPVLRFQGFEGEWEKERLDSLSDVLSGKRIPKGMGYSDKITPYQYLTVSDMGNKFINKAQLKYISKTVEKEIEKYKVYTNDIIVSVAGTLGLVALIDDGVSGVNLTENANRIIDLNQGRVLCEYLYYFLNSERFKKYIQRVRTLSSQPKLSLGNLRAFRAYFPSLPEQEKIAKFFSLLDEKIETHQKLVEQWELKKKGYMQKIFSQELRFLADNGQPYPEWEEKKLGDVTNYSSSSLQQSKVEEMKIGSYPVYNATGVFAYIDEYDSEEPYIGVLKDGAGVGRLLHGEQKSSVIGTLGYLYTEENIDTKFLYYYMKLFPFHKYIVGAAIPHIYYNDYKIEQLFFPSIEEQIKISTLLTSIDNLIEIEKQAVEHWQQVKKGYMQQMFV